MAKLAVELLGDATGLKASLAEAEAATKQFAAVYKSSFASMADSTLALSTAEAKLARETSRYGVGTVGAAQATLRYRREVDALKESQLAATRSVGRGLTTYVTAPLALVGYEAAKMGINFQQQMLLIQTQAGASASEVKNLSGQVLQLAKVTPQGPEELARGLYHLESLGLRGAKAMQTLKIASFAAGMGMADLETTSTALGAVVVTGIQGAQNYRAAMATLNATVGAGNMRMEDLAGSLGNVAPAAAAAGVSLPELGAAMATLTDRGFSAEEAATRLRMTLALIQAPSDKAKKALEDLGIDANSLGAMLRQPNGLLTVIQTLHDAVARVGDVRGNRDLLRAFGGGRSGLGMQTLVQSLNQPLSSYQTKLDQVTKGTRQGADNMAAYLKSDSYKIHAALSTIQSDLTKLGGAIAPGVTDTAKAVSSLVDAFDKLPGPIKRDIGAVGAVLGVSGPILLGIVAVRRGLTMLRTEFGMLGPAAMVGAAEVETSMAGIESSTAVASAEVSTLRSRLLGLKGLGPIGVAIALSFIPEAKPSRNPGAPSNNPVAKGFAHLPIVGPLFSQANRAADAIVGAITGGTTKHKPSPLAGVTGTGSSAGERAGAPRGFTSPAPAAGTAGNGRAGTSGLSRGSQVASAVSAARLAVARGQKGAQSQLDTALRAQIAADERGIATQQALIRKGVGDANKHAKIVQNLMADEASAYDEIASANDKAAAAAKKAKTAADKQKQFAVPTDLQIRAAKADASGIQSKQVEAAKAIKAWTEQQIKSHKLVGQALRDAYEQIAQENSVIGTKATQHAAAYVKMSSTKFADAITGLSRDQRLQVEQQYAQAEAHGGYVPNTRAAQGVVINGNITLPNVTDHKKFLQELQRLARSQPMQTRGRHGGTRLGVG